MEEYESKKILGTSVLWNFSAFIGFTSKYLTRLSQWKSEKELLMAMAGEVSINLCEILPEYSP